MESVLRPLIVYLILFVLFRLAGKRTLASITAFDFVLLLIVAEAVQQALIGEDESMTNGLLIVVTFIIIDIAFSLVNLRLPLIRKWMEDVPLLLVNDGVMLKEHMDKARVTVEDILHAARQTQGLENLDQVKYAILEAGGGITIVPQPDAR
jgi:uncharacterized membrane protein YcaP (DUF421 family)